MKKTIIIIISAIAAFSFPAFAADTAVTSSQLVKKFKKVKAEVKEVTFNVNLHCASCVKKIQENIAFEKGVKGLHVSLGEQIVNIKYDSSKTNEETLKNAILKLGVPVKGIADPEYRHNH